MKKVNLHKNDYMAEENFQKVQQVKRLIAGGEGLTVEFKTCRNQLNRDVYEAVCAFLNRFGGTLLLGVTDSGNITGVETGVMEKLRKDFVMAVNNPQKINPALGLYSTKFTSS